jgi:hypothetical protein
MSRHFEKFCPQFVSCAHTVTPKQTDHLPNCIALNSGNTAVVKLYWDPRRHIIQDMKMQMYTQITTQNLLPKIYK